MATDDDPPVSCPLCDQVLDEYGPTARVSGAVAYGKPDLGGTSVSVHPECKSRL